jgi:hypothetical protein
MASTWRMAASVHRVQRVAPRAAARASTARGDTHRIDVYATHVPPLGATLADEYTLLLIVYRACMLMESFSFLIGSMIAGREERVFNLGTVHERRTERS